MIFYLKHIFNIFWRLFKIKYIAVCYWECMLKMLRYERSPPVFPKQLDSIKLLKLAIWVVYSRVIFLIKLIVWPLFWTFIHTKERMRHGFLFGTVNVASDKVATHWSKFIHVVGCFCQWQEFGAPGCNWKLPLVVWPRYLISCAIKTVDIAYWIEKNQYFFLVS